MLRNRDELVQIVADLRRANRELHAELAEREADIITLKAKPAAAPKKKATAPKKTGLPEKAPKKKIGRPKKTK